MHQVHQPSFSVITVVLHDLAGLKKTYASLTSQQFAHWEWIVCDGGSGREMPRFLQEVAGPVHWVSEKDAGIYDAMNKGVTMCHNEYVVFMNAGDTFTNVDVLQNVSNEIMNAPSRPDLVFGAANIMFGNGRVHLRHPKRAESYLWHGLPANHQATYYKREVLPAVPYDLTYKICGDYFLAATLCSSKTHIRYLDKPLANFYVGGTSFRNYRRLFWEPYCIQRDVLRSPFSMRLASMIKRFASVMGSFVIGGFRFR